MLPFPIIVVEGINAFFNMMMYIRKCTGSLEILDDDD